MSYDVQIAPFIEHGVTFCLALSPSKAFVSFALRPGGMLLLFCPDTSRTHELTNLLNTTIRARGSSFEHPNNVLLCKKGRLALCALRNVFAVKQFL